MTEIAGFLELIGFDILLLGVVTLLFIVALHGVWRFPRDGIEGAHAAACRFLANISTRWLKPTGADGRSATKGAQSQEAGNGSPPVFPGFTRPTVILLAAACLGMFMNLLADELLENIDAFSLTRERPFLKNLGTEDDIKHYTVANLFEDSPARGGLELSVKDSRRFFQHAYAKTLASGQPAVTNMLRFEFLVLRFLRVLFTCAGILTLVGLAGLVTALREWRQHSRRREDPAANSKLKERSHRAAAAFVVLFLLTFVCLWLSGEQQSRYSKKLCHAYLALPAKDREDFSATPLLAFAHPTPRPRPLIEAEFSNTAANGKVSMLEFSGATAVAGELIVVDNESGILGNNSAGIVDSTNAAVFRVRLKNGQKPKVERIWSEQFARLGVAFDDLEGVTARQQTTYFIGSHSTDKNGFLSADRHVFLRLQLGKDGLAESVKLPLKGCTNLTTAIVELGKALSLVTGMITNKAGDSMSVIKDLNIEGLAAIPDDKGLFLGLRSPLSCEINPEGRPKALLLRLDNPDELFQTNNQTSPKLSLFSTLDLGGQGISSLEYDSVSESILIASTDSEEGSGTVSHLWRWRFRLKNSKPVKLMTFVGNKLEGVTRVPEGQPYGGALLLAFDEEEMGENGRQFGRLEVVRWKPD